MKTICGVLTAALVLISTLAAQAAEYQAFGAERGWNATFLQWLQKYKPAPENVSVGIEGQRIHAYWFLEHSQGSIRCSACGISPGA
jgi:hypothetical protein